MARTAAAYCFALMLAGCGDKSAPADAGSEAVKLDTFCVQAGLPAALRHTIILVDTAALVAAGPEEFRLRNPDLFKLVIGLADPAAAIDSGAVAPRERVTILAASSRTGTLTPVFTGCLPGASASELAQLKSSGGAGAAQTYFGSDINSEIRKNQSEFTRQLLLALMRLAKLAEPRSPANEGGGAASPFAKLLKPLGLPASDDPAVRRLFVFTDLSNSLPVTANTLAEARKGGFDAADGSNLRLGLAETYVVTPGQSPDDTVEQFLEAFLLGSQAKLERVGSFSPNSLAAPPATVASYRGSLTATSANTMPLTIRLAATRDGQLVNSWVTYTATFGQRATPLAGQFNCTGDRDCVLRSDPAGGLGQLWRITPGNEPEVREDAPFGGLRFLEAKESPQGLEGRIYDPVISIGHPGGGMTFEAKRLNDR